MLIQNQKIKIYHFCYFSNGLSIFDTNFRDTPTEKAAESFQYDPKPVVTYPYFLKVTGSLVRHIYRQALGQKLSMDQARAETLFVLETGYRNAHHRGFDAAYLDAQNSQQDGLEQVLANISDIIIETQREKHFRWVALKPKNPLSVEVPGSLAVMDPRFGPFWSYPSLLWSQNTKGQAFHL